jgi:hypothetical protein
VPLCGPVTCWGWNGVTISPTLSPEVGANAALRIATPKIIFNIVFSNGEIFAPIAILQLRPRKGSLQGFERMKPLDKKEAPITDRSLSFSPALLARDQRRRSSMR